MPYTTIKKPSDYFNTVLWTGNGNSTRSITGVGFQPDLTWKKERNAGFSIGHMLYDSVRGLGVNKHLDSSADSTEGSGNDENFGYFTSFDSDGFSLSNGSSGSDYVNNSSYNYVAWNWLASNTTASNTDGSITSTVSANTTSGFSIVSYTGNGTSDSSIGHGLGAIPKITITKNLTSANSWRFTYYFVDGSRDRLLLDTTASKYDSDSVTANDSSVFYVDGGSEQNTSGNNYIAYCFAEKQGFSKFGSYNGNGNANGTFVYTGFKPAFVMGKATSGTENWFMNDTKRLGYNDKNLRLYPNLANAEGTSTDINMDIFSNGFKLNSTNTNSNGSGTTYIYMAFAEEPLVGDNPATAR